MWGWRIFAIFSVILSILAIFDAKTYGTSMEMLGLAISVPATIGLSLFAFNKRFLLGRFWRTFAAIYILYSVIVLAISIQNLASQHAEGAKSVWIYITAFAVEVALQFFTALALWRYSTRQLPV
jgi:hypothetical protein